jgi:negative regulator of sigma E activity
MNEEMDQFDDLLREVMKESGLEKAPSNFTISVMNQIAAQPVATKRNWKPIISLRGWIGIAASLVLTTVLVIFFLQPNSAAPGNEHVEQAMNGINGFFANLQFPLVLVTSLAALVGLFGLDQFLAKRNRISA